MCSVIWPVLETLSQWGHLRGAFGIAIECVKGIVYESVVKESTTRVVEDICSTRKNATAGYTRSGAGARESTRPQVTPRAGKKVAGARESRPGKRGARKRVAAGTRGHATAVSPRAGKRWRQAREGTRPQSPRGLEKGGGRHARARDRSLPAGWKKVAAGTRGHATAVSPRAGKRWRQARGWDTVACPRVPAANLIE
ncbi:hypothetical protein VC83_03548 [Pseudogymnoascus destructans]|uniref:Uncharacterized protein n=1 Tax=Pseudogymnoascus destructans TaxID=655981 RepID=A0A177ADZ7_9PEZI|nr:uncharacterized protein VC83_03548 [Pseudogymnoascus destructans]OAF60336.1 hypothetical protein VC83_03548 [Pseudogymnoascus destructans]